MDDQSASHARSSLFTVRVWSEEMGDGSRAMRGEVRHVLSGQVYYFQDWNTLVSYLAEMWQGPERGDGMAEPC